MQGYLVTNLIDGTLYVGKTVQPIAHRWRRHLNDAKRQAYASHLHAAIRKYGAETFTIVPLLPSEYDITSEEELNAFETEMIRALRNNCRLYNLTDGGDGCSGRVVSEESRQTIGQANRIDLTDEIFHRWMVICRAEGFGKWHCRCECGTEKDISTQNLTRGWSKSCGCLRRETCSQIGELTGRVNGMALRTLTPERRRTNGLNSWINKTPEQVKIQRERMNHNRWHVNRSNGFNPDCSLCRKSSSSSE
jgi:group I intron endonuclease